MKLSEELKAWRETAGLKQDEAAKVLGITLRTLENWEQGFSEPRGLAKTAIQVELSKRLHPKKRK